ncbi:hypothetical protein U879_01680 [Defluviimonas sp. 20V17]|uniref:Membrane-anchored ribosome-binding protein, inhibits growth in stationary phase, ElaB/YqjD/DUF883 family n=1 Tax=Allgaiera indica TaxID=765699 RepID=A0AAN4UT70_9RHOB|nr:DUF883 family protein [Allgaiera indica]KDB05405.1 hypothetical protein U879_01680 [Defluviimonas sp. 20V17]GHE04132.1 hypothetical protein GCM10008024_30010 [Allgaiera indica]SDX49731.1 Membrane-anchored ribosome-binding protein, inhibits growth in stationary phase, ElaB/YqjD/DUF883 family [Allgaiera indica]
MVTTPTDSKPDAPELAAEVAALRAEMSDVISRIGKLGQDSAALAREGAKAKLAEGVARGSDAADRARREWASLERRVLAQTQEHPWQTLGIAAFGGLALGLLLRRR